MPIKNVGGVITYTAPVNKAQSDLTGVHRHDDFAVSHPLNLVKQVQFSVNPLTGGPGVLTLQCDVSGDATLNLTNLTGANSFSVMQPITGTSPTAGSATDTLAFKSTDGSIGIVGSSSTKSLDFKFTGLVPSGTTVAIGGAVNTNVGTQALQAIGTFAICNLSNGGLLGSTPGGSTLWGIGGDLGGTGGLNVYGNSAGELLLKDNTVLIGRDFAINTTAFNSAVCAAIIDNTPSTGTTKFVVQQGAQTTGGANGGLNLFELQATNATVGSGTALSYFDNKANLMLGAATRMTTAALQVTVGSGGWVGDGIILSRTAGTGSDKWFFTIDSSTGYYYQGLYGSASSMTIRSSDGFMTLGGSVPFTTQVNLGGADSHVDAGGGNTAGAVTVHNTQNTANAYTPVYFRGNAGMGASLQCRYEAQGANPTARFEFMINQGAGLTEVFRITSGANLRFSGGQHTTGSGSAALGSNCPATTTTAPNTWLKFEKSDGTVVYVPAWA